jgi:DNA-binding beta-propeller fold protein YncE
MKAPTAVYSDGTRFYVADTYNHRVLIWSSFPTTNGQPADLVIGQSTFSGSSAGSSRSELSGPRGMVHDGSKLYIADTDNHRVVIFDPLPATSGAAAVGLYGQADFGMGGLPAAPTQTSLKWPAALAIIGSSLYVTDNFEHRVLRFAL